MECKNLKHGLKCTKTDIPLLTSYVVNIPSKDYSKVFPTKIEAINHITDVLSNSDILKEFVFLIKVQSIKF